MKEIYEMHGRGHSARAIARDLGLARNTVLRYLNSPEAMLPKPRPPRGSKLDPYAEHIDRRLAEGLENCVVLLRELRVRGYVDEVVIGCGSEVIARHIRSYERDDFVYDPIHYLPLLEQKTGALDQAAPLQGWTWPDEVSTLRRLLESRMGRRGKREFVQVLRLLEAFSQQEVAEAAKDALRLGGISFDAVKHLLLCRLEGAAARAGPGTVSLPAQGPGEHHVRRGLHDSPHREGGMNDRSTLLLEHHPKELKLPSFLREYGKMAAQCAAEGADHPQYLLRLAELELIDRHQRMVERRIRVARFPAVLPSLRGSISRDSTSACLDPKLRVSKSASAQRLLTIPRLELS